MWRIALIDDDLQVLQSMRKAIPWEQLDAECAGEALDGEAGLALVERAKPDIVITDVYMPVMNGLDMIEALRARGYEGSIVILSGYSDFEYAVKALRLGVDDYLSKPITVRTLESVLERAIGSLEEKLAAAIEREDLRKKLELYEPFVEKEWLRALVSGTKQPGELEAYVRAHPLLTAGRHLVMDVELVRPERLAGIGDWNLYRFAVGNIAEELLRERGMNGSVIQLHGNHMGVLFHLPVDACEDGQRPALRELGEALIGAAYHYLRIQLHIGIGRIKPDWPDIRVSAEEALASLYARSCPLGPDLDIYRYGSEEAPDEPAGRTMLRTAAFYRELAEAVRQSQTERAQELVRSFTGRLAESEHTKPSFLQQIAAEVCTICKYALFETGVAIEEKTDLSEWHRESGSIARIDELERWLLAKLEWIGSCGGLKENLKHKQALAFMLDYIHENYAKDITIAELAEKVYISRNYLSHIFRKATGETFNNYVTRVRMEKARTLILEGKHLIYEVAEMVGYRNVPYFSTLFKKVIGVNPSELMRP